MMLKLVREAQEMSDPDRIHIALAEPDRKIAVAVAQAVAAEAGLELIAGAADARALLGAIGERTVDVARVDVPAAGPPAPAPLPRTPRRPPPPVAPRPRAG